MIKMVLGSWNILTVLLISVTITFATKSPYLEKLYLFDEDQRQELLNAHNGLRAVEQATNMQEMVWDTRLEKIAVSWAKRCDASHRPHDGRIFAGGYRYVGENIWWSNELYLRDDLQSPIVDFYNEKVFYNPRTKVCAPGEQCGHYTQVVWATSCAVGCAAAKCGYIKNGRRIKRGHIIICNYGPGGNKYDTRPYSYGPRCADCPKTCTPEGLCPSTCSASVPPIIESPKFKPSPELLFSVPQPWTSSWINKVYPFFPKQSSTSSRRRDYINSNAIRNIPEGPVAPILPDPNEPEQVCRDLRTECTQWASEGGCVVSLTVPKLCRKTCVACKPTDVFVVQPTAALNDNSNINNGIGDTANLVSAKTVAKYLREGSCINLHRLCDFWSDYGHCDTNHKYMRLNCFQACNRELCGSRKATVSDCKDRDNSCDFWASIGECLKNKYFMEWKCPRICRKCL